MKDKNNPRVAEFRIVMVTSYYPPSDGGIARYVREVIKAEMRIGLEINTLIREGDDSDPNVKKIQKGNMLFTLSAFWNIEFNSSLV